MKQCCTCKRNLEEKDFYPNKRTSDGLRWDCRACHAIKNKRYKESPAGREQKIIDSRLYRKRNPQKKHAQNVISKGIRLGTIIRPTECEVCGSFDISLQGHHSDYARPLDVIWVCVKCHTNIHKRSLKTAGKCDE